MSRSQLPIAARVLCAGGGVVAATFGVFYLTAIEQAGLPHIPPSVRMVFTVMGGFAILVGVLLVLSALSGRIIILPRGRHDRDAGGPGDPRVSSSSRTISHVASGRISCTHCAAPLHDDTEISPSGDVKCPFCRSWFNVRG